MGMAETAERRKNRRFQRRLPVRFGTEAKMCGGTVIDLSEGGLRVEAPDSFPMNSVVTVVVQFPRNAIRLRARVAWVGTGGPTMGFSFTRPEPNLARAYASWVAEVKNVAGEEPDAVAAAPAPEGPDPAPPDQKAEPEAPPRPTKEPSGSQKRRVETRSGQSFEILIERQAGEWNVIINQSPRQPGVTTADFEESFADYADADRAVRNFLQSH